ncbi:hypothetical protein [Paenibacillus sp. GCM10027626]|uniref:hypothetical protein n=1 Tax=Paenibacillus sp. GCM10027626 TaxID=3273411 RepID=UPI0036459587
MITVIGVGRKILASIVCSVCISLLLTYTGYDHAEFSNFIAIFMYSFVFTLIIGVPSSIVIDLVTYKIQKSVFYLTTGLTLHLIFAGIVVYLFAIADETLIYNVFIFAVFAAALGLWLFDTCLKRLLILKR